MTKGHTFLILVCLLLFVDEMIAQNEFNMLQADAGLVYITFDFDPAPAISIGYARSFAIDAIDRNLTLSIELMKPIFLKDFQNFQIELGSRIRVVESDNLKLLNRFSFILHSVGTHFYRGKNLSIEEALMFGRFGNNFYLAGETGYTRYLTNYIKRDDEPDAKGQWYTGAGGKVTFGMITGYRFDNGLDLSLRSGLVKTERFKKFNPAGPPIFANVGIGYQ